jgi:hypothetical protein
MKVLSRLRSGPVALLVAANLLAAPARAQAPANVTVNVFPGGFINGANCGGSSGLWISCGVGKALRSKT